MLRASLFMERWKRRQSEMVYLWDLENYENTEIAQCDYQGEFRPDPITKDIVIVDPFPLKYRRLIGEIPLVILAMSMVIGIFYGFMTLEKEAEGNTYLA